MKKLVSVILAGLLFVSCVTVEKLPNLEKIYVTNTKQINLLPADCISEPLDTMMLLEIHAGEIELSVLTYIQADENLIFMDLMNEFMLSMGTLEYDGDSVKLNCDAFPPSLKAEYIVNDFQNAFYKADKLKENLNNSKLDFEEAVTEENGQKKTVRLIKDKSKVIEEVTIFADSVKIKNYLRDYEYTLSLN